MPFDAAEHLQDLVDDGRFDDALQFIDQVLSDSPDEAQLHALRALLLVDLERRQEAAVAAGRARDLDSESPFVHFTCGEVALAQGEIYGAIVAAQAAQRLAPGYTEAVILEARARARAGQWPRVKELAESVLRDEPLDEAASVLLAAASEAPSSGPLSTERWQALAARFPLNPFARAGRAWTQLQSGQPRTAETEFRQALSLDPSLEWARAGLVIALKARNPIYRVLLRLFVRMSRLPRRTRNLLAVGGVLGYGFLRRLSERMPEIKPVVVPLLVGYVAFVVFSWLADPVLSLLLMARGESRQYLSHDDKRSGALVGSALALAVILSLISAGTSWRAGFITALGIGFTSFTVSAAYQSPAGARRTRFLWMAGVAATLSVVAGVVPAGASGTLLVLVILLVAASTWMSRFGARD